MKPGWIKRAGEKIRDFMPKGYRREVQWAGKKNRKRREMGGMILGVRVGIIVEKGNRVRNEERAMAVKVKLGEWWRVVEVYVNKNLESKLEELREWVEEREEGVRVLIGGILMRGLEGRGKGKRIGRGRGRGGESKVKRWNSEWGG